MGNAAPSSLGEPDPSEHPRPQPGQEWDALSRPKDRRGAQWSPEMESLVGHCIRHAWDTAPRQGESHHHWGLRVDATYDTREAGLAEWLGKPLGAAPNPKEWKRAEAPPNSNMPAEDKGRHKPQERGEGHHEGGSEYQCGRKGAYGSGHSPSDIWRGTAGRSNTLKNDKQRDGDPWQSGEPQGAQGEQGNAGEAPPDDPWGPYRKKQQGQLPQGEQQRGWGSQHWQAPADQTEQPAPARQRVRSAPSWEELWEAGKSHQEMRYGDWRCGNAPTCRFPNHAYRQVCKVCGDPKENAKWELPQDPRSSTCRCGAQILPHYARACRTWQASIPRPEGTEAVYDP